MAKSAGNMGQMFKSQLEQLQRNLRRKVGGPKKDGAGISQYFDDESVGSSEFDSEFNDQF